MDLTGGFYRIAHRIGFHPWEEAIEHPPFAQRIAALLDREQCEREPPYGRALDLGCGSGIWGVEMERRGWRVTGVDMAAAALVRARRRIAQTGAAMRLVRGDVTALEDAGVGRGFELILDTGTFHGLTREQRLKMGRSVTAIAAPGASMLLLVWSPRRRGPLPRGANREQVEEALPAWRITHVEDADPDPPRPIAALRPDAHWYRLRRA